MCYCTISIFYKILESTRLSLCHVMPIFIQMFETYLRYNELCYNICSKYFYILLVWQSREQIFCCCWVRSKWELRTFCRNNCINVVSWLYHATFHWYITRTWKQVSTQNMMNEHLVDLKKSAQLVSIRALWQSSWVLDQQSISQNRYFVQPMQWCGSSSLQLCNNCNALCWHFRHCTNSN